MTVATVACPDCAAPLTVPQGARPGDLLECPTCAGLVLKLVDDGGRWTVAIAHAVSCPGCDARVLLADTTKAGDLIECCGRRYRLSFEYGAFAAEPL